MTYTTRALIGGLLDAAVAKAEGMQYLLDRGECWVFIAIEGHPQGGDYVPYMPSTHGSTGQSLIEREHISTIWNPDDSRWEAGAPAPAAPPGAPGEEYDSDLLFEAAGPTALVAAMRVFVLMKLGEEIEL